MVTAILDVYIRHAPAATTGKTAIPKWPVTYAAVAATMSLLSGDQPGASMQGERLPLLNCVVESNEHIMDSPPLEPEGCTSTMHSSQGEELTDPHTPNLAAPEHSTDRYIPRC